ncbi:MAG: DUF6502 family protein [Gammaproteobacteria bacterium]|jgi:hypothetical protein
MDATKRALLKATLKILKPLVQILMRYEVSHGEFSEIAKQAYVDVAYKKFSIPSRKTTYSRVAVLTGLSRKDVVRITEAMDGDLPKSKKASANRVSRVVSGWLRDAEFCDKNDQPLSIPLKGSAGSFDALVSRYGGDVTSSSILEELLRVGAVTVENNQRVKLTHHTYVPDNNQLEKIDIFSSDAADLLSTGVHNVENDKDNARFQRHVIYYKIPESVAEEFKNYSNKKSNQLLLDYNRWLGRNNKRQNPPPGEATKRLGVGIYYFENDN